MTFAPNLEITETTRINGTLETRTVTPLHRVLTPKPPPSRNAWSSYKIDGDQYKLDTTAPGVYTPQPPDAFRDTIIDSQRPCSRFETSKTFDVCQDASEAFATGTGEKYDPEREELIRDFLTRKEIESYEREIENEKKKLYEDTQRAYEDHIRAMSQSRSSRLNANAASEAVKAHINKTVPPCTPLDTYSRRFSAKPLIPKAPTYGQAHYPKTPHPKKYSTYSQRASRPTSAAYGLQETSRLDDALTTKRVMFQSPRPGSAAFNRGEKSYLSKNADHFFQWRDAVSPAMKASLNRDEQPWKMSRFTKSAQPRITTRWDSDLPAEIDGVVDTDGL